MKKILELFIFFFLLLSPVFADDMRFIQISDANFSKDNSNNYLEKVIIDINKQKNIDFVVFTGDNLKNPSKTDLEYFSKEIKKLKYPFYIVLGDKDVNKHKHLSKKDYFEILKKSTKKFKQDSFNYVFKKNKYAFFIVDGSKEVIPSTNGFYKDDVINWLDKELENYSQNNVIIFQHFPIIPPSNREMYITLKPEKYLEILKKHNNIKAVISGHFGQNKEQEINNIIHISTSGLPTYKIIDILDYETTNPTIWTVLKSVR